MRKIPIGVVVKICIFLVLLLVYANKSYVQTVSEIRADRQKILSLIEEEGRAKIEEALNVFDTRTLKEFLSAFDLLKREKTKKELINRIIKALPIILKRKDELKLPFLKRSWNKLNEKYSKTIPKVSKTIDFIIYEAARILYVNKPDKKGYKHIILFGKVKLELANYTLKSDTIVIRINNKEQPIEAYAYGNIVINEGSNVITGRKIYFFPKIDRAIIVQPRAYFKPFYIGAKEGKRVAPDKYNFSKGYITTDNVKHLHYKLAFDQAWYYNDEFVWLHGATYVVGQTNMFWAPLLFRSSVLTGVLTSLGYEDGIGWYTNNTLYYIPGKSIQETRKKRTKSITGTPLGLKFMLDYYQRLGVYFGNDFIFNKYGLNIQTNFGLAYDRSLDYINGTFTNSFDHIGNDGIPDETNNFRWSADIKASYDLIKSGNASSSLNLSFKTQSDPAFKKHFASRRIEKFTLFDVFNLYNKETLNTIVGFSGSEHQKLDFGIKSRLYNLTFNIGGNLNYLLQYDLTDPSKLPLNPYATKSYKQYLSSIIFPKIDVSYSHSFQLIGKKRKKEEVKKKKEEPKEYVKTLLEDLESKPSEKDSEAKDTKVKIEDTKEKEEDADNRSEYEKILDKIEQDENLILSLPLTISVGSSLNETQRYTTGTTNTLISDIFTSNSNVNVNLPFSLSYKFLKFTVSTSGRIMYNMRQTKNATVTQKTYDEEYSFPSWSSTSGSRLSFNFFEEYNYLKLSLSGGVRYSKGDRFTAIKFENGAYKETSGRSETISYDVKFSFLKSSLSVSTSDNLYISPQDLDLISSGIKTREEVLNDQHGNLSVQASTNPIEAIRITNSYSYSRRTQKNISNSLSVYIGYTKPIKLAHWFYFKSIGFTNTWYHNYENPRSNSLRTSFNISFGITRYWIFSLKLSSVNKELYRYSSQDASKYGKTSRNFFLDLLDSFNFFDQEARQRSLFKLEQLSLSIAHDLHEWIIKFDLNLRFKEFSKGVYYFEPAIYVSLYLKVMPSIEYPKIEKVFTKQ